MNDISKSRSRHNLGGDVGWSLFDEPLDNLFEGFFRPMRSAESSSALTPAVDISEREHDYLVKTDLPGIKKEDIKITLQDGILNICAERKQSSEQKEGERVIRRERRYGKYSRSLQLSQEVDEAKVTASFNDGVLELILPKKEPSQPKAITVDIK